MVVEEEEVPAPVGPKVVRALNGKSRTGLGARRFGVPRPILFESLPTHPLAITLIFRRMYENDRVEVSGYQMAKTIERRNGLRALQKNKGPYYHQSQREITRTILIIMCVVGM